MIVTEAIVITGRFGAVQSVRLRSVPIRLDKKLPRRAAILAGRVSGDRGTAHAYVVFKEAAAATAALELNMKEVRCTQTFTFLFSPYRALVHRKFHGSFQLRRMDVEARLQALSLHLSDVVHLHSLRGNHHKYLRDEG